MLSPRNRKTCSQSQVMMNQEAPHPWTSDFWKEGGENEDHLVPLSKQQDHLGKHAIFVLSKSQCRPLHFLLTGKG